MGRKRSPECDWICTKCGCPCGPFPGGHVGGGQNRKACKGPSRPMLRADWEAMMAQAARDAVAAIRWRRNGSRPGNVPEDR